jgi:8-oxo-dGTP pyrophosphatase MutT (NUDIX family)
MTDFRNFIAGLKEKLARPLPGLSSQLKMASVSRIIKDGNLVLPEDVRKAGVLVLFYPCGHDLCIAFIKRAEYPGVHSGQISFPGGGREKHDKDITETALREAEEEIGVDRKLVTTIGNLSDLYIPPSNFLVTPVVGYTQTKPVFIPDPEEVETVLEISFDELVKADSKQEKEISIFPALNIKVPCYYVNGNVIWGATAMIISELIDVISPGS